MNFNILHKDVQHFINEHLNADISKVLFKGSPFDNITIQQLVQQIEAKNKSKKKLPTWYQCDNIYYPNKISIEQASSEITAEYKSELISGKSIVDLSGGLGIDTYYYSKQFAEVTHCELDPVLSRIATHNFNQLQASITTISEDGLTYLKSQDQHFDWIYIDPSRRDDHKRKVFLLKDCEPNIPENLDVLFEFTENILIKASPILDISSAINELKFVKEVHVIALENEVKELVLMLHKDYLGTIQIKTSNIKKDSVETFDSEFKTSVRASLSEPLSYLYEPNAAILKAGLFHEVSNQFNIYKLHENSHLYTSDNLVSFPGRRFKIQGSLKYDKKQFRTLLPDKKANITTRNFPETVAQIRKRTEIKEGGTHFLFFTTDQEGKHIVLVCEKI